MWDSLQLPRLVCAVDPVGGDHCLTTVQAGFHLFAPRDEVLWLWGGGPRTGMAAGLPAYLLATSGPGQFCVSCFGRSIFRVYRYINQGHVFCFEVCLVLPLPFAFILTPAGPRERFPNLCVLLCGCGVVCAVWSSLLTPLVVVWKACIYACQPASMRVRPYSCGLNCRQRFVRHYF